MSVSTNGVPTKEEIEAARHVIGLAARVEAASQPKKLKRCDLERMLNEEPPPEEWIAERVIPKRKLCLLYARGGTGKSMYAGGLTSAIAKGNSLAGIDCEQGRVLYIDAENGEHEIHKRVRGLSIVPGVVEIFEAEGFDMRRDLVELEENIAEHRPSLVVLDSFRSLCPGIDENDTAQVAGMLDRLRRIAHGSHRIEDGYDGCALLVIHHSNKGGHEHRGTSSFQDSVDVVWQMGRLDEDPDPSRRFLQNKKMRGAQDGARFWLRLSADRGLVLIDEAEPPESEEAVNVQPVRTALTQEIIDMPGIGPDGFGLRRADIARGVGKNPKDGSVGNALAKLVEDGIFDQLPDKRYRRNTILVEDPGPVDPVEGDEAFTRADALLERHADIAEVSA
jgi:hypothetical protein